MSELVSDFCSKCGMNLRDEDGKMSLKCGSQEYIGSRIISFCVDCYIRPVESEPKPILIIKSQKPHSDVYWDGKPEEGLADDPVTGKPRVFGSKGEKAAYLKDHGLQEAGDRIGGAHFIPKHITPKVNSREEVMQSLQKVKNMGKDYRRNEYLRIIKEGAKRR